MAGNESDNNIWWDIESAGVPKELDADLVYGLIQERLIEAGYTGNLRIRAFTATEESVPQWVADMLDNRIPVVYLDGGMF
ncbi:unnamed protein product [Arabis nemorensis]|uniref:NYN domain-containing protein n=1 Tax=Arabis nemorensis TaxID=586526 RepID=A0A565B478_9BRAS|nr:unnamed protein product [Arabis nemorensis]